MSIRREEVTEAAKEAEKLQGYDTPAKFYGAALATVKPAVANSLTARPKVAVEDSVLMSEVFSLVEAPTEIADDDPDRELKTLVYKELHRKTWRLTHPLSGQLQKLLMAENGHVICRYGGLNGRSVYTTNDPDCFRTDVIESRSAKDIASVTKLSTFYGGVGQRIPALEEMIADAFDLSLQGMLAAGRAHIPLLQQRYSDGKNKGE